MNRDGEKERDEMRWNEGEEKKTSDRIKWSKRRKWKNYSDKEDLKKTCQGGKRKLLEVKGNMRGDKEDR